MKSIAHAILISALFYSLGSSAFAQGPRGELSDTEKSQVATALPAKAPAAIAQAKLGWRFGVTAWGLHKFTLYETIDKTRELGLDYVGGLSFQKVSTDLPRNFDADLTDEQLQQIRLKMDAAGIRMPTFFYATIPGDEKGCRNVFEFGRKMGIETFISDPPPE